MPDKLLDFRDKSKRAMQSFVRTFGPGDPADEANLPMDAKPKRWVDPKTGKEISRLKSVVVDTKGNLLLKRLATICIVGAIGAACFLMYISGARARVVWDCRLHAANSNTAVRFLAAGVVSQEQAPVSVQEGTTVQDENTVMWGSKRGFCMSCVNAPYRRWSWWFGWGECKCHAGWSGTCCDIPKLNDGECALYDKELVLIHDHSVVPGIPFHKDLVTSPCSNAWSIDALGQGVAPVVVNMLYNIIDEQPPDYVVESLDDLHKATKDNSYWSLLWEVRELVYGTSISIADAFHK